MRRSSTGRRRFCLTALILWELLGLFVKHAKGVRYWRSSLFYETLYRVFPLSVRRRAAAFFLPVTADSPPPPHLLVIIILMTSGGSRQRESAGSGKRKAGAPWNKDRSFL